MRRQHMGQRQVLTYDIMCKYQVHYRDRIKAGKLVDDDEIPEDLEMKVPVWHQGGHVPSCMDKNALRYTKDVGRTHGEGVEPIWAETNGYGYATREMGHGHRIENLSEVYNEHNHRKMVSECTESHPTPLIGWRADHGNLQPTVSSGDTLSHAPSLNARRSSSSTLRIRWRTRHWKSFEWMQPSPAEKSSDLKNEKASLLRARAPFVS